MGDFLFKKIQRQAQPEPESLLDFTIDAQGEVRLAGSKPKEQEERQKVRDLRILLKSVEAGEEEIAVLSHRLLELVDGIQTAIARCHELIAERPDDASYFVANVDCYERSIEGLTLMLNAIDMDDAIALWKGMAGFESAVQDLEVLLSPP